MIPKDQVKNRLHELSAYDEILVQCRSGVRSADITRFLMDDIGLKKVKNVKGGILAWSREIDPTVPTY
jgi:adenylyltransferase/sulfurtransferase